MKKNTPLWIFIGLLILVIILLAPRALDNGRGVSMHPGYGMMDRGDAFYGMMDSEAGDVEIYEFGDGDFGMMEFRNSGYGKMGRGNAGFSTMSHGMAGIGWLIPVLLFVLVIAAGVWLGNVFSSRKFHSFRKTTKCQHCSEPVDDDWTTCPYCSKSLKK